MFAETGSKAKKEASAQEITPNNFSDILSEISAKIFFTPLERPRLLC
jgi:hypothetical protein